MAQLPQIDSLRRPNAAASAASKPRRFPWLHLPLAIVITLLVGYGLIIVYSAVRADGDYQYSRQLGGVAVGLIFMILVWRFDYRRLSDYTTLFLIINVVLIMS
ncbi:FtsW/RodA/SpoVE family cell cycle protein, partial [Senegalimassilia anaerobia]